MLGGGIVRCDSAAANATKSHCLRSQLFGCVHKSCPMSLRNTSESDSTDSTIAKRFSNNVRTETPSSCVISRCRDLDDHVPKMVQAACKSCKSKNVQTLHAACCAGSLCGDSCRPPNPMVITRLEGRCNVSYPGAAPLDFDFDSASTGQPSILRVKAVPLAAILSRPDNDFISTTNTMSLVAARDFTSADGQEISRTQIANSESCFSAMFSVWVTLFWLWLFGMQQARRVVIDLIGGSSCSMPTCGAHRSLLCSKQHWRRPYMTRCSWWLKIAVLILLRFSFSASQPSAQPTSQPSTQPSRQPSCQPTNHPSLQPTSQPTSQPSCQPSSRPTQAQSTTFYYTGAVQSYNVPAGVASITVTAAGAQGGQAGAGIYFSSNAPGLGGLIVSIVSCASRTTLYVYVGGAGKIGLNTNKGGFNGGGNASTCCGGNWAGGGGGASDIRTVYAALSSRLVVAGGGGGK